jgi:hypothetical protein
VSDDPTELYGDSWQNRPVGWPGRAVSSSPESFSPERKNPSENATRDVTLCERADSRECGFVLVRLATVSASPHSQLRKPARPVRQAGRYVEVGGSGGIGWTATAAPGRGTEKSRAVWSGVRQCGGGCYV